MTTRASARERTPRRGRAAASSIAARRGSREPRRIATIALALVVPVLLAGCDDEPTSSGDAGGGGASSSSSGSASSASSQTGAGAAGSTSSQSGAGAAQGGSSSSAVGGSGAHGGGGSAGGSGVGGVGAGGRASGGDGGAGGAASSTGASGGSAAGGSSTSSSSNSSSSSSSSASGGAGTGGDGGAGGAGSCSDGVLSGDESDIDCGGSCPGCLIGESCGDDSDCSSVVCLTGTCTQDLMLSGFIVSPFGGAAAIDLVDLDGDGDLDAVAAGPVRLIDLHGGGDGTFSVVATEIVQSGTDVHLADLNEDGLHDVVLAGLPTLPAMRVRLRQASGYAPPVSYGPASVVPGHVQLQDVTGDKHIDAVVGASSLHVFHGNGDGSFASPVTIGAYGEMIHARAGWFDGDAFIDYATLDEDGGLAVFLGLAGNAIDTDPSYEALNGLGGAIGLATADLDADGHTDLTSTAVYLGNGDGTFVKGAAGSFGPIALGDLDGDGRIDQVSAVSSVVAIRLGNGDGTFTALPDLLYAPGGLSDVRLGDVDGNGRLDIVCVGSGATEPGVKVLLNL